MRPMILLAAALCALTSSCTFNLAEETRTLEWRGGLAGVHKVIVADAALESQDLRVAGTDLDSAAFSCTVQRLKTEGDETPDDLAVRANIDAGHLSFGIEASGENWVTSRIVKASLALARTTDVELSAVSGDIRVDGMQALVQADNTSGDISVESGKGCDLHTVSGDVGASVLVDTTQADSAAATPPAVRYALESTSGDVTVELPEGVRALLDLETTSGTMRVAGHEKDGRHYSDTLVGRTFGALIAIECLTTSGDITIETIAAQ
jgi:hypothetical protein